MSNADWWLGTIFCLRRSHNLSKKLVHMMGVMMILQNTSYAALDIISQPRVKMASLIFCRWSVSWRRRRYHSRRQVIV